MQVEIESHNDLLGREVVEGDAVAFMHHNSMMVGKVIKITPKQIRVIPLMSQFQYYRDSTGYLKYAKQCVLIGGPDLTMWILKQQGR